MLEALTERASDRQRDAMYCAGIVAAAVYNVHLEKGRSPVSANDFLPAKRAASDEELIEGMILVFSEVANPGGLKTTQVN